MHVCTTMGELLLQLETRFPFKLFSCFPPRLFQRQGQRQLPCIRVDLSCQCSKNSCKGCTRNFLSPEIHVQSNMTVPLGDLHRRVAPRFPNRINSFIMSRPWPCKFSSHPSRFLTSLASSFATGFLPRLHPRIFVPLLIFCAMGFHASFLCQVLIYLQLRACIVSPNIISHSRSGVMIE
jgi:hypothetical protein